MSTIPKYSAKSELWWSVSEVIASIENYYDVLVTVKLTARRLTAGKRPNLSVTVRAAKAVAGGGLVSLVSRSELWPNPREKQLDGTVLWLLHLLSNDLDQMFAIPIQTILEG